MDAATSQDLFWVSFWLYFASFALFAVYAAVRVRPLGWVAAGVLMAGFVPHTVGLLQRWTVVQHLPIETMHEYANLMSWMIVAAFIVFLVRARRLLLGIVVSPSLVMMMVATSVLPREVEAQMIPALRGSWMAIHVGLTALAEAAFALGCALGVAYLICAHRCKRAQAGEQGADRDRQAARLAQLHELGARVIALGYPLFTVGALFAGSIWALEANGTFWAWNPKEVSALVIWLCYTGYLYARVARGWRADRLAWISVAGFALVLLSFLSNLVLGPHPQG
jgi:cytochrome c-type biogenesis protein CcsB